MSKNPLSFYFTNKGLKAITILVCIFSLSILNPLISQNNIIPENRIVDWSLAGINIPFPIPSVTINILDFGAKGDGLTPVDSAVTEALNSVTGKSAKLYFPAGKYLFKDRLRLKDSLIIEGEGASLTRFIFNAQKEVNAITISGKQTSILSKLKENAYFKSKYIVVNDPSLFSTGQMIYLNAIDTALIFSDWAIGTAGQHLDIVSIKSDTLEVSAELRRDFLTVKDASIGLIKPIEWAGVKCLSIERQDSTIENLANIIFYCARNCFVSNVESEYCNFSHITAERSSHIDINRCYFHNSLNYGGGGRGYGICFMSGSGDCRAENNIFNHLRHAMLLQSGANGNVFAYNYSRDPFWTEPVVPSNSSGDIVCHGNYPYVNLFEGNICQNIYIDNSHGNNGPLNTFFRNRAELYGIYMSTGNNSDRQNFIGNEITTSLPFVGFLLQCNDHFSYGNNVKGIANPPNSEDLDIKSLCYKTQPDYLGNYSFPLMGYPNSYNTGINPAFLRYQKGIAFTGCEEVITHASNSGMLKKNLLIYPNPSNESINFNTDEMNGTVYDINIYDCIGQLKISVKNTQLKQFNISILESGLYIIHLIGKLDIMTGNFIKAE